MSTHYGKSEPCGAYLFSLDPTLPLNPLPSNPEPPLQFFPPHPNSNYQDNNNHGMDWDDAPAAPEELQEPEAPGAPSPNVPRFFEQRFPGAGLRSEEPLGTIWERLRDDWADPAKPFLPFGSKMDWQVADWFARSGLSQAMINELLQTDYVSTKSILRCSFGV